MRTLAEMKMELKFNKLMRKLGEKPYKQNGRIEDRISELKDKGMNMKNFSNIRKEHARTVGHHREATF